MRTPRSGAPAPARRLSTAALPAALALAALLALPDAARAQAGGIAGSVIEENAPVPIAGATVYFLDTNLNFVWSLQTDGNGLYDTGLFFTPGTYFALAVAPSFSCEVYAQILWDCVSALPAGTPITVTDGNTTTGIDFSLAPGGEVAGIVIDAATQLPIAGVDVLVVTEDGEPLASGTTDPMGHYVTQPRLTPFIYRVVTANGLGYVDEVWDDHPCIVACDPSLGDDLQVLPMQQADADFALVLGGRLAGRVFARGGGLPLPNAQVSVWNAAGEFVDGLDTDAMGGYLSRGLPAGTYYALAGRAGYETQLYSNRPCWPTCQVTSGTPIAVTVGATQPGIDFHLGLTVKRTGFESGGTAFWSGGDGGLFCPHDACEEGEPMELGCDPCVDEVCSLLPDCCLLSWDAFCVQGLFESCAESCP
jgi:hypothetical protein